MMRDTSAPPCWTRICTGVAALPNRAGAVRPAPRPGGTAAAVAPLAGHVPMGAGSFTTRPPNRTGRQPTVNGVVPTAVAEPSGWVKTTVGSYAAAAVPSGTFTFSFTMTGLPPNFTVA